MKKNRALNVKYDKSNFFGILLKWVTFMRTVMYNATRI
jgi:hypothetical protein